MKPQRIQLSRKKGFNLQAASRALNGLPAVNCARPGYYGNPFPVIGDKALRINYQEAVDKFRDHVLSGKARNFPFPDRPSMGWKKYLRGKNLACWCPLERNGRPWPCHCDVLLEIANA